MQKYANNCSHKNHLFNTFSSLLLQNTLHVRFIHIFLKKIFNSETAFHIKETYNLNQIQKQDDYK